MKKKGGGGKLREQNRELDHGIYGNWDATQKKRKGIDDARTWGKRSDVVQAERMFLKISRVDGDKPVQNALP